MLGHKNLQTVRKSYFITCITKSRIWWRRKKINLLLINQSVDQSINPYKSAYTNHGQYCTLKYKYRVNKIATRLSNEKVKNNCYVS